jgi:hypothetical protein
LAKAPNDTQNKRGPTASIRAPVIAEATLSVASSKDKGLAEYVEKAMSEAVLIGMGKKLSPDELRSFQIEAGEKAKARYRSGKA